MSVKPKVSIKITPKPQEWTKEDEEKLEQLYGKKTLKQISNILKRETPSSVRNKANRMGLSASYNCQGHFTLSEFARLLKVSDAKVRRWISQKQMPHRETVTAVKKKYTLIDVKEFWQWAEVNKELIDFYKIEPLTLLPEPSWFQTEREKDKNEVPRRTNKFFTPEEDQQLLNLFFKEGLTQKSIAKVMERSDYSIRNRLRRLREQRLFVN